MEQQFDKLRDDAKPYFGTLVIDMSSMKVVSLVGLDEDVDDYYWVFDVDRDKRNFVSCCLGFTPLKGVIPDKDYEYLKNMWNLNNIDQVI